MGICRLYLIYC